MKRIQLVLVVAAVMVAMLAALPGPAMARDNDRADRVENRIDRFENRIDRFEDRYDVDLDDEDVFYYPNYYPYYYPYYSYCEGPVCLID
jgi:hypothetical protein